MSNKEPQVTILYEDDDCAVLNKPAGIMVHGDGKNKGPFLTDWITEHFPEAVNAGEDMLSPNGVPLSRPGIVHRLDRETSGVIIIAKTPEGHASLKKQFQDRTIAKKYLAYVWGELKEEFGTINRPIGRSGSDFRKWSAGRGMRGDIREAETYWTRKAVGTWNDSHVDGNSKKVGGKAEKISLVEVEPKTGRTHQIRVHFNAVNHPVVGDVLYAPKRLFALGFNRLALHALSVDFNTVQGRRVSVSAPLPDDFIEAAKALNTSGTQS